MQDDARDYVASKIARYEPIIVHAPDRRTGRIREKRVGHRKVKSGWTPFEAINYAYDRDAVTVFRDCLMLVLLCGDAKARMMPEHRLIHQAVGLTACVGPTLLVKTAESLGISDQRAGELVSQLYAETRAFEGLTGSAS
jgi:hypothetical protein